MKQRRAIRLPDWSLPKLAALGTLMAGAGLLLIGLLSPWMTIPVGMAEGEVVVRDAGATLWWKVALVAGLALAVTVGLFPANRERGCRRSLRVTVLLIPVLLAFPSAVIVHDEETSGHLAWLQQQHDSMTWLGGDVFLAQGLRYQQTMPVIDLGNPPQRLAAFRPPTVAPWSLGIAEMPDLVWWLGYNPAFCQFVARGWVAALLGVVVVLVGWMGWRRRDDEVGSRAGDFKVAGGAFVAGTGLWLLAALAPVLAASHFLREARREALDDRPREARADLERACAFMPALRCDTGVIEQLGRLDLACGETDSMRAELSRARSLRDDSYRFRAAVVVDDLWRRPAPSPSLGRELSRMMLALAVEDANSGRVEEARARLERLCERERAAIQPRFYLQLLSLHGGQIELNRRCQTEVAGLYRPFQRKEKKGVLSASWLILAQGELAMGRVAEAAAARQKARTL